MRASTVRRLFGSGRFARTGGERVRTEAPIQTPFAIDISGSVNSRRVALRGELDIAHADELEQAVHELCAEGARELVVDLAAVEFIDSSGLRALLGAMSFCGEHGCVYLLAPTLPQPVRRLFEVAGVGSRFAFAPTVGGDEQ